MYIYYTLTMPNSSSLSMNQITTPYKAYYPWFNLQFWTKLQYVSEENFFKHLSKDALGELALTGWYTI